MRFTIEIPDQGDIQIYDQQGRQIQKMSSENAQNLQDIENVNRAGTLNMTFLKTNSGYVIIGGRMYYIP